MKLSAAMERGIWDRMPVGESRSGLIRYMCVSSRLRRGSLKIKG